MFCNFTSFSENSVAQLIVPHGTIIANRICVVQFQNIRYTSSRKGEELTKTDCKSSSSSLISVEAKLVFFSGRGRVMIGIVGEKSGDKGGGTLVGDT